MARSAHPKNEVEQGSQVCRGAGLELGREGQPRFGGCTVRTTTRSFAAANSLSPAYGARRRILATTPTPCSVSWTDALRIVNRVTPMTMPRSRAKEYAFTLKYQLADNERDPDALLERLGGAGCDDALVGIGQPGRLALKFTREAAGAEALCEARCWICAVFCSQPN